MRLHGYFRSTASWRVRIALSLKGIGAEHVSVHLRRNEQRAPGFLALNPQGLVPTLELDDGTALTQSLAILEYIEEIRPAPPLLPADPIARARVRAFALAIAADIHPIQNLKILRHVRALGADPDEWGRWVVQEGLAACEAMLAGQPGPYCFGDAVTLADLCLVPQLGNARRFGCDLAALPRLLAAEAACAALPAFAEAVPERQPDAE